MTAAALAFEVPSAPASAALPPLLEVRNFRKRFGALLALDDVSFRLEPGSVHALLGENGAGKSTLVKCIMGFHRPDSGRLMIGDRQTTIKNPRDARDHGIGMVYQHFTLVENMTVEENFVLARRDVPSVIDWNEERSSIEAFMKSMPFRVATGRLVRQLAAGEKQKLEILKQLYLGSRIVILDEPTSVLTPQEADDVLGMLRDMAAAGRISVAMITHKLREVMRFADEVTVLRRGRLAGGGKAKGLGARELAELMVGAEPPQAGLERPKLGSTEPVLVIGQLRANDDLGLPVLEGIDIAVHAGEIVGVAGVSGNGQDELVEVLAGQRGALSGTIRVGGEAYRPLRDLIRRFRVRLLPESPLRNACVPNMTVAENMAFRCFDVAPYTRFRWFLQKGAIRRRALDAIKSFRIKTPSPDAPISQLSGGNVQRAVLARELSDDVTVLICANPCFGLDLQAVSEIRDRIVAARNAGTAVLLVSADLDEIFALADRILVMSEGKVVFETRASGADMAEIGRYMAGHGN